MSELSRIFNFFIKLCIPLFFAVPIFFPRLPTYNDFVKELTRRKADENKACKNVFKTQKHAYKSINGAKFRQSERKAKIFRAAEDKKKAYFCRFFVPFG